MNNYINYPNGGPGTGSLGGPPSGHNYKRAVYRPPPKVFSVQVLPPTKFGNGYCYGMRIIPAHTDDSDGSSSRTASSNHEYEVWRRWEDCLWFQEIIESEYALMARQKRARLVAGKGVKKNGVYIHSDKASSWDSLPPGPDAKSIAKDIHPLVPRLTKKGTLFRASQATIEHRGSEFQALIYALFKEDVPMLVRELREIRLVRDFFGYWRRDLDHDRKRQLGASKDPSRARNSITSSMLAMYFSASNTSLHSPPPLDVDLPPSPALPSFRASPSHDSSRRNSIQRDERRRSTGRSPPITYATSDSSGSTVSVATSSSRGSQHPTDMPFYVSTRGSLALNLADEDDGARAEFINTPLSAPTRVHPISSSWSRDPEGPLSLHPHAAEDVLMFIPEEAKIRHDTAVPGEFHPGLQALPEECEFVPAVVPTTMAGSAHNEIQEVPRVPARRPRGVSSVDKTNRQCLVFGTDGQRGGGDNLRVDTDAAQQLVRADDGDDEQDEADPRTPTTSTTTASWSSSRPSSAAWSAFSCGDAPSSRTSFATSFANGSCAEFDRLSVVSSARSFATSFADGSCADWREGEHGRGREDRRSVLSVASAGGRRTALGHRDSMATLSSVMSELSFDSSVWPRSLTPPPSGSLRRSLSAGSRRPSSIMATLSGQENWYEQQEELLDAYFYDPGMQNANPAPMPAPEPPRTPSPHQSEPPFHPFNTDASTPERFPKPFQNRPPGQFHLPWTPPPTPGSGPALSEFPTPPSTSPTPWTSPSRSSPSSVHENVTLKAIRQDSIVLLRVPRAAGLADVRMRLRDKFAAQEGVQLARAFVIGWSPSHMAAAGVGTGAGSLLRGGGGGRPRANSASSVGTLNPGALRYVCSDEEWAEAVAACSGAKMTIRLFDSQPI